VAATTTFGTIGNRVAARLIDPNSVAVSLSQTQQAINDSIFYYKNFKFFFNQKLITLTMDTSAALDGTANSDPFVLGYGNTNSNYPNAPVLPSDFLYEEPDNGFVIPYNNLNYTIQKKPPVIFDNTNVHGIGLPFIYTYRDGNYEFYFLPNIAYKLNAYCRKDYVPLVLTGDNNDFTNYADKLIEYDAISRLLSDLRLDDERADRFAARAQQELRTLQSRSAKQNATGSLTVESIIS
jgi:hypothetical protein